MDRFSIPQSRQKPSYPSCVNGGGGGGGGDPHARFLSRFLPAPFITVPYKTYFTVGRGPMVIA